MSIPLATLAGVPLEALNTVGWRLTQGVKPYTRTFDVHKTRAAAILKRAPAGTEVDLYIGGRRPVIIQKLSVLSLGPSNHPDRVSVLVADRRYWWDWRLVRAYFNIRRPSGEMRLVDGKLQRVNALPDVTFAKYSLLGEVIDWRAADVIKYVLGLVTKTEGWSPGKVDLSAFKSLDVDGLILEDDGQTAVKRALDYVPSLTLYMSKAGIATLTLTTGGEEEQQLGAAAPPVVGPDLPAVIDMSRVRPSAIELYFQCEDEVRFDYAEGAAAQSTTGPRPREPRALRNVLPLPDRQLTIAGKVVVQGTWVEINQALLDAWNADTANPPRVIIGGQGAKTLRPISFDVIRKLWFSPGGYHLYHEIQTQNPVWGRRWNAIMKHYRQTFQVDRRWRDRIRSARAERVAIADPENARRAPADAIGDHAVLPSVKRVAQLAGDPALKHAYNKLAWPVSDTTRLLKDGNVAETGVLTFLDEEQLVYRVVYKPDQDGNSLAMCPSLVAAKSEGHGTTEIPTADPRRPDGLFMMSLAQLSPLHRLTTVFTVVSASPQGLAGFHKITITPSEAKSVLPQSIATKIGECKGPVYQMFVAPGVTPASFAWQDEAAAEVEGAILEGKPRTGARLIYPDHVRNVARSMAAITYALFADRVQGAHVGDLDPEATPVGRISAVVHELGRKGVLLTRREMPASVKALSFRGILPDDTRRLLFGKVTL